VGPYDLDNPETAAIGLDAAALVGKAIAEVRALADRGDCALVLATEEVPGRLPAEVMEKEPNVYEGKPSLTWMYQTEAGEWRSWYAYIVDQDWVRRVGEPRTEVVLAQVYTSRARATPGIRVRPIISLSFDLKGVCVYASDAQPQFDLLRIGAEERMTTLQREPSAKARMAAGPDPVLGEIAATFGLQAPSEGITLGEWDPANARTSRLGWTNECELRRLMLMNGQLDCRVTIGQEDGASWWLLAREGQMLWPAITIDERGLRVVFQGPNGDAGPAFDVRAGRLGIELVDANGDRFATSVFIAQRGSPAAPSLASTGLVLLGHSRAGADSALHVSARLASSEQRLEVTSPRGTTSLAVIGVRRNESRSAILVSARPEHPFLPQKTTT
jgi:hypothetical protein